MASQFPSTPIARLTGHKGPIHALTYSAGSGQYLLSGSSDRTINLYNPFKAPSIASEDSSVKSTTPSPALVQSYNGAHAHEILTLAVAGDNSRFVSGGGDKTVFLWDVATAKTLRRYGGGPGGHGGRIECVAFGGEGDSVVVSGSFDSSVRLWDTKSRDGRPLMVLSEARDSVSCLVVGEAEVVAGSVDGRVRGYDLRMGMVSVDVIGSKSPRLLLVTLVCAGGQVRLRMFQQVADRKNATLWELENQAEVVQSRTGHLTDSDSTNGLRPCIDSRLDIASNGKVQWQATAVIHRSRLHQ